MEKIPRATPLRIANIILAPRKPPVAAVVVKADLHTRIMIPGISLAKLIRTPKHTIIYSPDMKGTTFVDT
ncbi:hypothetical protein D3C78_1962450 [compost metagenome]